MRRRKTSKPQPRHVIRKNKRGISRRNFLLGVGGVTMTLPFLESFALPKWARAQAAPEFPVFSVFMRQGNGVQQGWNDEPDRFWPSATGALTTASMSSENKATSILAPYASRLLLVNGCKYPYPSYDCGHSSGIAQCLTAQDHTGGTSNDDLAMGISVDTRIADELTPGTPPLTLVAGPPNAYIGANLSYQAPQQRRPVESNPYNVYLRLFGDAAETPEIINLLAVQRKSVNDLVRAEMQVLMGQPALSYMDKQRLDMHFDAIRDMETTMVCEGFAEATIAELEGVKDNAESNDVRDIVVDLHSRLIALTFACDLHRTCTFQIGTGNDQTKYYIDGEKLPYSFHWISHRRQSDGSDGPLIDGADLLHHAIDKKFAGYFLQLLDYLDAQMTPAGHNLLDDCVAVWLNDLGNGPPHAHNHLPYVMAGSGGGFLKTGQYIDVGSETHNKWLNTVLNAVGVRKEDGSYVDDFGAPGLDPGMLPEMLA